jgi:MerR family transcriptional regulator, aldehyde-responsive regulator
MKISEVAERTGLSLSTIRYYEKSGLSPEVKRSPDGRRRFSATDTDWFLLLASLRETGMSLSDMRAFATLYQAGDETVPQRQAALMAHRKSLDQRQADLDCCRTILDRKLKKYEEILEDPH